MTRFSTRAGLAIAVIGLMAISLASVGEVAAGGPDLGDPATVVSAMDDDYQTAWHGNGVLEVSKLVEGPNAPTDVAFEICLTGPLPGGTEQCKTFVAGQTRTFHDLEPGAYRLEERNVPDGFDVSYSATNIEIIADTIVSATVTNRYQQPPVGPPVPVSGRAEVAKVVTGDAAPNDASFEICLTGPLPDGTDHCQSVTGGTTAVFDDLEPGTYTLVERDVPVGFEVSYSTTEIEIVAAETAVATVTNEYRAPAPAVGRAEVTKVVTGYDAGVDEQFEICLTGPLPDGPEYCQSVTGGETAVFGGLELGTYSLEERNVPDGYEVTYSSTEIEIVADATATATITNHRAETENEQGQSPPPPTTTPPPPTAAPPAPTTPPALPATGSGASLAGMGAALVIVGGVLVLIAQMRRSVGRPRSG